MSVDRLEFEDQECSISCRHGTTNRRIPPPYRSAARYLGHPPQTGLDPDPRRIRQSRDPCRAHALRPAVSYRLIGTASARFRRSSPALLKAPSPELRCTGALVRTLQGCGAFPSRCPPRHWPPQDLRLAIARWHSELLGCSLRT